MAVVLVDVEIDDAGTILMPSPDPIPAVPGEYVVFIIDNQDTKKHKVSISPAEFKKKKATDPDDPIDPLAVSHADVDPGDTGAIVLRVKGKSHFKPGTKSKKHQGVALGNSFTYKYTIRATGSAPLDPDIEINN
jgi:hypothetical protein